MKILYFTLFAFMTSNILAEAPAIVNGIKTSSHHAVVHLKFASQKSLDNGNYSTCTGTFFKAGYIITAAHCLGSLYLEKRLSAHHYIKTGRAFVDEYETKVFINDEKVARKQSVFISKVFRASIDQAFQPHYFISALENSINEEGMTITDFQKNVEKYRDYFKKLESRKLKTDLAIIKVEPKRSDKLYKLNFDGVSNGDDVLMVGYGASLSAISVKRIENKIQAYSVLIENGAYSKKVEKRKKALVQALKLSANNKRIGRNKVEHIQDGLIGLKAVVNSRVEKDYKIASNEPRAFNRGSMSAVSLGDSGGPLLYKKNGEFLIKGIASRTGIKESGSDEELTSIYTNLSSSDSKDFIAGVLTGKYSAEF